VVVESPKALRINKPKGELVKNGEGTALSQSRVWRNFLSGVRVRKRILVNFSRKNASNSSKFQQKKCQSCNKYFAQTFHPKVGAVA